MELIDSTAWYGDLPRYGGHDSGSDHLVFRVRPRLPPAARRSSTWRCSRMAPVQNDPGAGDHRPGGGGSGGPHCRQLRLTITNYGLFGARAAGLAGAGLRFPRNAPYTILHRGGLVLGTSSLKVSDAIREMDFAPAPGGPIRLIENGGRADQEGLAFLREKSEGALNAIGVRLRQSTLAWRDSPNDDFVIFEYSVHNPHPAAIRNLYLGLYADWDIPDSLPSRDAVASTRPSSSATSESPAAAARLRRAGPGHRSPGERPSRGQQLALHPSRLHRCRRHSASFRRDEPRRFRLAGRLVATAGLRAARDRARRLAGGGLGAGDGRKPG